MLIINKSQQLSIISYLERCPDGYKMPPEKVPEIILVIL